MTRTALPSWWKIVKLGELADKCTADREIELLIKELEQHKLIKKYLMQQLLTGKIRVKGAAI